MLETQGMKLTCNRIKKVMITFFTEEIKNIFFYPSLLESIIPPRRATEFGS
jgi:hypothetical protein